MGRHTKGLFEMAAYERLRRGHKVHGESLSENQLVTRIEQRKDEWGGALCLSYDEIARLLDIIRRKNEEIAKLREALTT